jgi:hypothetical protein
MKTAINLLLAGVAGTCLLAAKPEDPAPAPPGKFLILDNDQLIEGDIRREGDHYSIRRGSGETIVSTKRVVAVVGDRKQALKVMREHSNPRDWDERIRIIKWCMENGLREDALADAEQLVKFRPADKQLIALVEGLRTLKIGEPTPAAQVPQPSRLPDKVIEVEKLNYNPDTFPDFVSRVQPILMNTCAGCHALETSGNFKLVRVFDGSNRKAALHNLAAVLKHLNRAEPTASPLLARAIAPHGKAVGPPIRDRQAPAYLNLEAWAIAAVGGDGEATPPSPPSTVSGAAKPPIEETKPEPKKLSAAPKFGETSTSSTKVEPQTEAKDPFDPAIFNGTIQPKK